tara:strand:- start:3477 stop:3626 length:150 start_codon:yes stop_codon:yes gene_type:complete
LSTYIRFPFLTKVNLYFSYQKLRGLSSVILYEGEIEGEGEGEDEGDKIA